MKSPKRSFAQNGTASSELGFLRELVLRQQATIESLTRVVNVSHEPTVHVPQAPLDKLPDEVSKAIAEVTEPDSDLGKQLKKRASYLIANGTTLEDVKVRITQGERPDV